MPKMKTKSAAKKRFKITGTGKVKSGVAFKRHCLGSKSQKMKRTSRGTMVLAKPDGIIIKRNFMPYG
jgi:large subunit ribosomal protein L35